MRQLQGWFKKRREERGTDAGRKDMNGTGVTLDWYPRGGVGAAEDMERYFTLRFYETYIACINCVSIYLVNIRGS